MAGKRPLEGVVVRVLVTGAAGFVGRSLVPHLLEQGHEVAILVREQYGMGYPLPSSLEALRPQLHIVYADLRNYHLTARAVQEAAPEAVFHLAAAGVTDPFLPLETALRHNQQGTLNLLRASLEDSRQPADRVIIARTPGERSAMNVYAASKAAAWQLCRYYANSLQWPVVGAMIFQAYGPGQPAHTLIPSALAAALAGQDFPMTSGEQERDWIYLDDVLRGLAACLPADLTPGTTVELGTGRPTTLLEVVQLIYELVDRGGKPLPGALPSRPGEAPSQIAQAAETTVLLEWRARIDLRAGIKKMLLLLQ